ncbi:MAG: glycosyltransferase family 2 protein [Saprospiraceae bacterium]
MSSLPSVAIISVNYNQTPLTAEMLESLQTAGLHTWCEAWVVDNASTVDGSVELSGQFPWVRTIRSEKNLGFAGGNNLAIRKTEADYIFLLNNDALIDPGVLEGLLDRFRQNPKLGALSPVIYDYPQHGPNPTIQYAGATAVTSLTGRNETLHRGEVAGSQPKGLNSIPFAHGAAMLVSREALLKTGLMEEGYFLYYEELDWCDRIRNAGFEIALDGDRAIWHRESVSTGEDSAFKIYWINRSRILYMRRNKTSVQSFIFKCFYLISVLPLHGVRHLLADRKQHAKALLRAYTEQPSISTETEHLPVRKASPPKPILTAAKA